MGRRWVIAMLVAALGVAAGISGAARAAWPGTNDQIVSLNASSTLEIAKITTYDPSTREVTTVVGSAPVDRQSVVWSPDGKELAWVESRNAGRDLRIRQDDGTLRWLTDDGDARTPSWTPDGKHLVYVCGTSVCQIGADGSGKRVLIGSDYNTWNDVSLSPDGAHIAFRNGPGLIVSNLSLTSGKQVAILSGDLCPGPFKVAWSPDGNSIAWCDAFQLHTDTTLVNAAVPRILTDDDYGNPAWSPDGTTLVYPSAPSAPNGFQLHTIHADGSDEQLLLDADGAPVSGDDPDWRAKPLSPTAIPNPPAVAARPAITGDPIVGHELYVDEGIWNGDPPLTYTYQWVRCDSEGVNCADISNATETAYTVSSADVGMRLRVNVTATNTAGQATSGSDATNLVTDPNQAPTIRAATAGWTGPMLRTKITACDDAAGQLTAVLTEWGVGRPLVHRMWSWRARAGCQRTEHAWKLQRRPDARYVMLRVRDAHGLASASRRVTLR